MDSGPIRANRHGLCWDAIMRHGEFFRRSTERGTRKPIKRFLSNFDYLMDELPLIDRPASQELFSG